MHGETYSNVAHPGVRVISDLAANFSADVNFGVATKRRKSYRSFSRYVLITAATQSRGRNYADVSRGALINRSIILEMRFRTLGAFLAAAIFSSSSLYTRQRRHFVFIAIFLFKTVAIKTGAPRPINLTVSRTKSRAAVTYLR